MKEPEFKNIQETAKLLGLDPQKIYDWRVGYGQRSNAGRPPGKRKRKPGFLSMGDCLKEYGIKGEVLRKWREMGMSIERKETMIMVSRKILAEWMEKYIDDLD